MTLLCGIFTRDIDNDCTFQGDTAEHPEFPDPLSPHAGDAVHPVLRSRRVWFTRLVRSILPYHSHIGVTDKLT